MIEYSIDFTDGAKVKLRDTSDSACDVLFTDKDTDQLIYKTKIQPGNWAKTNQNYYKNWNVKIFNNDNLVTDYDINLNGKLVLIRFQSSSLGDTLSWIPYVEEFRKKHNCILYCSTFLNYLFDIEYPEINFIQPGATPKDVHAIYNLGWFNPQKDKNPRDYKTIPLQKSATDILGLEYEETKPLITTRPLVRKATSYKYVCIAEFSTANAKHWHYPHTGSNKGWQTIVDWLNHNGYKVMVISKQHTQLKNVIDRTGEFPLEFRVFELQNCEFFIGVGSGLSWLAWALGKKVVMISGFSEPFCEFKENNIRIINKNVCNGCFNKYTFDRGDWNWCPRHKNTYRQFECTKNITPKMVIDKIVEHNLVEDDGKFTINDEVKDINLQKKDIELDYVNNKFTIHYKNETPLDNIHIDIRENNGTLLRSFRNSKLKNDIVIWSLFDKEYNNNSFLVDFFNDKKHLTQVKLVK